MLHGFDRANAALERLRASWKSADISDGTPLADGIWVDLDRETCDLDLRFDTTGAGLVTLTAEGNTPGRWMTLNVNLESGSLAGARMIGFATKLRDAKTQSIRAVLRSFHEDEFVDVAFPTYLFATDEFSSHCDFLWIAEHESLIQPATWRALLLFLEPGSFTLEIAELNVFAA